MGEMTSLYYNQIHFSRMSVQKMINKKIFERAHAKFEKFIHKKLMDSKNFMLIKLIRNAIFQFNKLLLKQEDRI